MGELAARKTVTKIEANPLLARQNDENAILRVAAYCRVSTDKAILLLFRKKQTL